MRACVCVSLLAGSGGPASRARCGAPNLFLWPVLLRSLFARPYPGWGRPLISFCAPRLSPAFLVFRPGLPPLGVLPPPPFFFSVPFSFCASVVSGVPCFPALGALGLGIFLCPPPPPPFFSSLLLFLLTWLCFFFLFVRPRFLLRSVFSGPGCLGPWRLLVSPCPFFLFFFCFSSVLFSSSPGFFFFYAPPLSLAFRVFRPGVPWALAPCCHPRPPPVLFFPSCLFFAFCFFSPRLCLAGGAVRGSCVCPGLWGVLVCASVVLSLSLLFVRCSLAPLALAGVVWCCPSCLGVCCLVWLSFVASWWVLVLCFGGAVPVWPRGSPPYGLVWCVLVLRCPVWCSVALCCAVVWWLCCRALLFVRVVASACCLFPAAWRLLCVFWGPVLCVPCPPRPVRCCAALCRCPCVVLSAWSALFLVLGAVGAWCCYVFLGVRWWLWLPGIVVLVVCVGFGVRVWPRLLSLGIFPVVSCSPVLCPMALCCRVVLCCGALSSFFPFFLCLACGACSLSSLKHFL